ncbi:Mrp/NBP35 family ATP-binding protein [Actibacterium pelagium]|uniref:Iron-sulfur cluster carrier protein n=1 Tax=Actibacterium pelagium TaxID=2029103 RepID=A0A917EJ36_9RHOB|nr:Mrp/NBP35 family ATP-binding protein [Actibacterium pelagium]GGE47438.1 iron-sulfur cluster carrier protein [Actibacterium pelagium]
MSVIKDQIAAVLGEITGPGDSNLMESGRVKALTIEGDVVRFVLEAASAEEARSLGPLRDLAQSKVEAIPGVAQAVVVITAHSGQPAPKPAPSLKIGQHPTKDGGGKPAGVDRILAVASGKGGVGKSTVSSNLAVALARQGRRVGLLDADIYGPSQPRMMGVSKRPASPDGKTIIPLKAHGVTMMSIGLMVDPDQAVVWRGPMLMGALQQMLGQVEWGELDVLIVDLPPGTGDVQLTLCQKSQMTGALVVSTPQDVALLDARKAIDMFGKLKTPVLGLIENMSSFCCPHCGGESHIFGHGGVRAEADRIGVPFLGELPLALEVRQAGDAGTPIALQDGPVADAYAQLAHRLVAGGMA